MYTISVDVIICEHLCAIMLLSTEEFQSVTAVSKKHSKHLKNEYVPNKRSLHTVSSTIGKEGIDIVSFDRHSSTDFDPKNK